ncbi:hypothetical protein [Allohahella sp. A8]|uniref:phage adaptor protein n=1 Tax=Allohahella sp. A8 TaxID=3141461 RepID=UPI003A80C6DE
MTFLELCRAAYTRIGYSGAGPSAVTDQSAQSARVVDYVEQAWLEIQRSRENWKFMLRRFDQVTEPGITHLSLPSTEVAKGDVIRSVEKDSWYIRGETEKTSARLCYLPADHRRAIEESDEHYTGRPNYFWHDRKSVRVSPTPDRAYRITGDYYITPQTFASSDSADNRQRELSQKVPEMPEEYHIAIVWLAVRSLAAFEGDGNAFQMADGEYRKLFNQICTTELPTIRYGAPLA